MQRLGFMWEAMALILIFTVVCGSGGQSMQITSSAFPDGGKIPLSYVMPGAWGQNILGALNLVGRPGGHPVVRPGHGGPPSRRQ